MTPLKVTAEFWMLALFAGTTSACPHGTDPNIPATFHTSDSVYRCRACLEDDPPPPNLACDRCAGAEAGALTQYRTLPIVDGVSVAGALCGPCITQLTGNPTHPNNPMLRITGGDPR